VPEPNGPYWLQLVDWALEAEELVLDRSDPRVPSLLNMLDLLRRSDPKLVMVFVEKEELENGEYEECLVADPQKEWHPVDLAWQVLDHLDSRLSASLSNYPRANSLQ
jgi:hypothetical protein